jgi:hypothetical protein
VNAKFHWLDATVMSYADWAGTSVIVDAGLGVVLGEVATFVGAGLTALSFCQINFFPLLMHFKDRAPDLTMVPTLGHTFPGALAVDFEVAMAKGAARTVSASSAVVMIRDDFLREAFMEKTLPSNECQH